MISSTTILVIIIFTLILYVKNQYGHSRNKQLFFKEGFYKSITISLIILLVFGVLITVLLPVDPVDLSYLQLHSENISNHSKDLNIISKYFYQSISVFTEMNFIGLFVAIINLAVWIFFIRGLDFFDKEKLQSTLFVLFSGMFLIFLSFPLSDFIIEVLSIKYSNNFLYDLFLYNLIGKSIVEESIKLVPVFIILFYTNEIDEPIDLIYYACISALGFSFIDNLYYFKDFSGSLIIDQVLLSSLGHMISSTFAIYGVLLYKFNPDKKSRPMVLAYFLIATFNHSFFNYLQFEGLLLLYIPISLFIIQFWIIMINNSINNSTHFTYEVEYKYEENKFWLTIFLCVLLLINFLMNGLIIGKEIAFFEFLRSLVWGGLLIMFYVTSLSSFDLIKGYWRPIKFRITADEDDEFDDFSFKAFANVLKENTIIPLNHVGKKISLHSPLNNPELSEIFHIGKGQISERLKFKTEEGIINTQWFLIDLETPFDLNEDFENNRILIKIRNKYSSLIHDTHIECWLKLIPAGVNPLLETNSMAYVSYGLIGINGYDYVYDLNETD